MQQGAERRSGQPPQHVVDAFYRTVLAVGGRAYREPTGREAKDGRRPDSRVSVGPHHVLVDVVITHSLAHGYTRSGAAHTQLGVARVRQSKKHVKGNRTAAQHHAQMLAFSVERVEAWRRMPWTDAPHSRSTKKSARAVAKGEMIKHVIDTVSIAVHRGTALVFLAGYTRAMATGCGAVR